MNKSKPIYCLAQSRYVTYFNWGQSNPKTVIEEKVYYQFRTTSIHNTKISIWKDNPVFRSWEECINSRNTIYKAACIINGLLQQTIIIDIIPISRILEQDSYIIL